MILERIVEAKREEVSRAKSRCLLSDLKMRIDAPPARDFIGAVRRDDLIQQNEGVSPDKPDKAVGPAARISSACDFYGRMRWDAAEGETEAGAGCKGVGKGSSRQLYRAISREEAG
jgi:hypothetical protein